MSTEKVKTESNKEPQSSPHFEKAIRDYITNRAEKNPFFKEKVYSPEKSIKKCVQYIFSEVQRLGFNGFEDKEIYAMAMHYYDEENVEAAEGIKGMQVIVNHMVELTPEEIESAKKEAKDRIYREAAEKMHAKKKVKTPPAPAREFNLETKKFEEKKVEKVEEKPSTDVQQSLF